MAQQTDECESGVDWLARNLVSEGYLSVDISHLYSRAKQLEYDYMNNEIDNALAEYKHNVQCQIKKQ